MFRIIDGRSKGKTNKLMLYAKEHNALFVCATPKAMELKARMYGIVGLEFISYHELYTMARNNHLVDRKIVIDELENYINFVMGVSSKLIGYSISED